jgi:hypothetical protein
MTARSTALPPPELTCAVRLRPRSIASLKNSDWRSQNADVRRALQRPLIRLNLAEATQPAPHYENAPTATADSVSAYVTPPGCRPRFDGGPAGSGIEIDYSGRPPRPVRAPELTNARYGLREVTRGEQRWMDGESIMDLHEAIAAISPAEKAAFLSSGLDGELALARLRTTREWQPRAYQQALWRFLELGGKRACVIWHRRSGKDDVSMHWACEAMLRRVGEYWHMLPEAAQGRKVLWDAVDSHTGIRRIDRAFPSKLRAKTRDNEMSITFSNGSLWRVVGSDNYNSLVGSAPVGIVFSEWALSDPSS